MAVLLRVLERGAAALRRLGLDALVDRVGPAIGRVAARREVTVNGLRLSGTHFGHLYYLRELAEGRDRFLATVLCAAAGRNGVAVDAGAYIGYLTVELARAVGPAGRVYAVEPDPAAAAALSANARRNSVDDRVRVIEQALAATPGRAVLYLSGSGQTNSLAAVAGSHGSIEVAVTTIDDVLAGDTRVDLVKIDVEGAELLALGGMRETLRRERDIALVVECNPTLLERMGSSAGELLARLETEGFAVWQVDERAARLTPTVELEPSGYVNLACARGRPARIFAALERG